MHSAATAAGPDRAAGGVEFSILVARPQRAIGDDASGAKAEALADAVRSLLAAGLAQQARPLVDELVALIRASRGPLATVVPIRRPNE